MLNLHVISVAVEIQQPFFYCILSRVPKKNPQKYCYSTLWVVFKFIFENLSEHGFELATCLPEKSHHIYISATSPLPINFLIYKHSVFLTNPFLEEKFLSHTLIFMSYIAFYVASPFFLPTHAF